MNSMISVPYRPIHFVEYRLRGPRRRRTAQTFDAVLRVMDTWRQRISDRDHLAEMDKKMLADTGVFRRPRRRSRFGGPKPARRGVFPAILRPV